MRVINSIYPKLPVFAQHVAISSFGIYWRWLRFGPGHAQFLRGFLERESFQSSDWENWQSHRLEDVLKGAISVSYYSKIWTKSQKDSALAGKLLELPLLEKEPLRAAPHDFLRTDMHPIHPLTFYTSGSTGTPIATIWRVAELRKSQALREARSARWAGVSFHHARGTFSGRMVEPNPESKGPFYRLNLAEKQVYFSPFHLRPGTAKYYIRALEKHHIRWLTGYAVSYYLLAKFILGQGLAVPSGIQAVITTSEKLTSEMRTIMEQAFGCRVFEEYSNVENSLFASECEHGRLHVSPDVAVVEILRPDGSPCLPGEAGEVVATTLMRTYQPLIRFRLGDMAMWDTEPCPCGRQMPVIKEVIGRIEDVVIGPDGRQMVRFHGIFTNQPHIREGQIIQESMKTIRVKVVTTTEFGAEDIQDVTYRIQQRLGDVTVLVEPVSEIPRTKAGKFQAVISNLNNQGGL
ncbi:MAG: phenylacetate--CoA ligase family protein [Chloroflexi bacterium]|nr:phenylacetate--CoA ligase family protein [Chloroflexota bacterium]